MPLELSSSRQIFGGAIALVGIDAAINTLLPPIEELPGALSVAARKARIDRLKDSLLEQERLEEEIIEAAQADGQIILRRPDVNIAALLGVEVR